MSSTAQTIIAVPLKGGRQLLGTLRWNVPLCLPQWVDIVNPSAYLQCHCDNWQFAFISLLYGALNYSTEDFQQDDVNSSLVHKRRPVLWFSAAPHLSLRGAARTARSRMPKRRTPSKTQFVKKRNSNLDWWNDNNIKFKRMPDFMQLRSRYLGHCYFGKCVILAVGRAVELSVNVVERDLKPCF